MRRAAGETQAAEADDVESGQRPPGKAAQGAACCGMSATQLVGVILCLVLLLVWSVASGTRNAVSSDGLHAGRRDPGRGFIRFEAVKKLSDDAMTARERETVDHGDIAKAQTAEQVTIFQADESKVAAAAAAAAAAALQRGPKLASAGASAGDSLFFFSEPSAAVRKTIVDNAEQASRSTLIVLTTANSQYQEWQKRVTVYTIRKCMPERFFRMVTLQTNVLPKVDPLSTWVNCSVPYMGCPVIESEDVQNTQVPGDSYIVHNRAYSMNKYFQANHAKLRAEGISNIILWEPDIFMIRPVTVFAEKGKPVGHEYFYMQMSPYYAKLIPQCTPYPEYYSPIGLPMVLHIDDLMEILPRWVEKTKLIRSSKWAYDEQGRPSWLADMISLCCVLCDLKMRVLAKPTAPEPPMDPDMVDDAYSFGLHWTFNTKNGDYYFEKRDWWMGAPLPRPFGPLPREGSSALQIIFADTMDEALVAAYGKTDQRKY